MTEQSAATEPADRKDVIATAAIIASAASLLSLVGAWFWSCLFPLAFLAAAAGMVLGYLGREAPHNARQARAAMLISGFCLLLQALYLVFLLFIFGSTYFILNDPAFWERLMDGF